MMAYPGDPVETRGADLTLSGRAGVEVDFGPCGSQTDHVKHSACGTRLRVGKREGDSALVYWCPAMDCLQVVRVIDRPPYE